MHLSQNLENKSSLLTDESKQKINVWVNKFPQDKKQSALIAALFIAQEQNKGHLTSELIAAVADYLEVPRVTAQESATFYTMYEHDPVGKYKISVCTNVSCTLCGSAKIVKHLKDTLGIDFNETTSDGKFTLKEVECLGACIAAPVLQVNDKDYHENLTVDKVNEVLQKLD